MRVVIFGPPGAGKGTQAAVLSQRAGMPHLATGNILREEVAAESPLGLKARSYMDRGDLVPDDLMIEMIESRLGRSPSKGFILDGFPRTVDQADALESMLGRAGRPLQIVLCVVAPEDELIRRMTGRRTCPVCQRSYHMTSNRPRSDEVCDEDGAKLQIRPDDEIETFKRRLVTYHERTEPLAGYYAKRGLLVQVDGSGSVEEVAGRIEAAVHAAR